MRPDDQTYLSASPPLRAFSATRVRLLAYPLYSPFVSASSVSHHTLEGRSMMTDDDRRLQQLLIEASTRRLSRRQLIRRGVALGLSAPAIGWVLAACGSSSSSSSSSAVSATSQAAAPTPSASASSAATASSAVSPSIPIASASPEAIGTMTGTMKTGGTPQNGGDFTVILGATSYTVDLDPHSYYDINTVNFGS